MHHLPQPAPRAINAVQVRGRLHQQFDDVLRTVIPRLRRAVHQGVLQRVVRASARGPLGEHVPHARHAVQRGDVER